MACSSAILGFLIRRVWMEGGGGGGAECADVLCIDVAAIVSRVFSKILDPGGSANI